MYSVNVHHFHPKTKHFSELEIAKIPTTDKAVDVVKAEMKKVERNKRLVGQETAIVLYRKQGSRKGNVEYVFENETGRFRVNLPVSNRPFMADAMKKIGM